MGYLFVVVATLLRCWHSVDVVTPPTEQGGHTAVAMTVVPRAFGPAGAKGSTRSTSGAGQRCETVVTRNGQRRKGG